jgi:hypothetical protein
MTERMGEEPRKIEDEPRKPSQWLREGSRLVPEQAFRRLVILEPLESETAETATRKPKAACAAATMLFGEVGLAGWVWSMDTDRLYKLYLGSQGHHILGAMPPAPCPVAGCAFFYTPDVVLIHLNDDHKWDRERIAQWLEDQGV